MLFALISLIFNTSANFLLSKGHVKIIDIYYGLVILNFLLKIEFLRPIPGLRSPMEATREKFTIEISDNGMVIRSGQEKSLYFSAGEALMLLDILKNEESNLRKMADEASPIPIRIQV